MENPAMLSEKTLPDLKQLMADAPCFHAVRMLYLKNLAVVEDIQLKTDLRKMAIHVPDRLKLFLLLESDRYKPAADPEHKKKDGTFDLVERFLLKTGHTAAPHSDATLAFTPAPASDYTYWLLTGNVPAGAPDVKLQRQDLIDSFLEKGDERIEMRLPDKSSRESEKREEEADLTDSESTHMISLNESYFTETLSHVYMKQKRYDKALEIIKTLSLKYPEKNIYFADQIRFIEKLIIHTKS
jgi:hypothetical protein